MKEPNIRILALGLALAGSALSTSLRADTTLLFGGGNASQTVLYDRVTNLLSGGISAVTIAASNTTVRTYVGTIASQPGLGTVTINFSLLGAIQGLQDLNSQNTENTALGGALAPTVAVSSTSPEAVGVDSSPFVGNQTLVVPYAYIKPPGNADLAGVTNLTQRQAYYLEGSAGTVPISYYGGASTNYLYFVARNTASAVRTETDANVYFTGTPATYITNAKFPGDSIARLLVLAGLCARPANDSVISIAQRFSRCLDNIPPAKSFDQSTVFPIMERMKGMESSLL